MADKRVMTMDDFEHRLMVSSLMTCRNEYLREEKPTEDLNELILKVVKAPHKRDSRRELRDEAR